MIPSPRDVFEPGGLIARRLERYESRDQQVDMALAVQRAIDRQTHLIVEAGTGVGKSFAYLVPAVLAAAGSVLPREKPRKIVVSTHTISLQEQLISRDIPFLNAVLPVEFSAVLVKGRSNYISLRRLQGAAEKGPQLWESDEAAQLKRIRSWAQQTGDGSLSDLGFVPLPQVWDDVRSEHGNCLGRRCPTFDDCYYFRARRRVWNADLLVVNHALFFSDLALRREGASLLPDYDVVILDEAHSLEDVAAAHLGVQVSSGQFNYQFNRLYNDQGGKGLLVSHNLLDGQRLVSRLRILTDLLFDQVERWSDERNAPTVRVRRPLEIDNPVSEELRALAGLIRNFASDLQDEGQKSELNASADRLNGLGTDLAVWLNQKEEEYVYWIESTGRTRKNIKLMSSPVDVAGTLRDEMFANIPTVILTSATLATGKDNFQFFRERIGLTRADELQLGSPFDYRRQATLILPDSMPDPGEAPAAYETAVVERIQQHVDDVPGGAFVLFTSYRMLQNCARRLTSWFAKQNRLLLCQGEGLQRSLLLERFRQDGQAVLFGTESFWQGVDVPGEALKNVIITKLPFSVPDHPLLEARVEKIREQGGNPFMQYQVPEAAIKLRQGFGRLIRSATDTGQVVILDPRVRTKRYGRIFLDCLPDCERRIVPLNE